MSALSSPQCSWGTRDEILSGQRSFAIRVNGTKGMCLFMCLFICFSAKKCQEHVRTKLHNYKNKITQYYTISFKLGLSTCKILSCIRAYLETHAIKLTIINMNTVIRSTRSYTNIYVHMRITHKHTRVRTFVYTHIHSRTYTHLLTRAYTNIHVHVCTHVHIKLNK